MEKFFTFVIAIEYILMTLFMFFIVKGWFSYIAGTITLIIAGFMFHVWFTWPIVPNKPKQGIIKKPALYGRRHRGLY